MHQLDGTGDRLKLIGLVDDFELLDIDIVLGADVLDHFLVTHEGGGNDSQVDSLAGRLDGVLVDSPRCDHPFAYVAGLQLGENIREFGNHGIYVR